VKYALVALANKPRRFSGFLHGVAMEVAPGVFLSADFNRAAFERIWRVLEEWHSTWPEGWIVAVIPTGKPRYPPEIRTLGVPTRTLVEHEGIHLLRIEERS
jgi:CRISPR-associated endoribonuclease Cas2 subtype I-E